MITIDILAVESNNGKVSKRFTCFSNLFLNNATFVSNVASGRIPASFILFKSILVMSNSKSAPQDNLFATPIANLGDWRFDEKSR